MGDHLARSSTIFTGVSNVCLKIRRICEFEYPEVVRQFFLTWSSSMRVVSKDQYAFENASTVEHRAVVPKVAGSSPVSRPPRKACARPDRSGLPSAPPPRQCNAFFSYRSAFARHAQASPSSLFPPGSREDGTTSGYSTVSNSIEDLKLVLQRRGYTRSHSEHGS